MVITDSVAGRPGPRRVIAQVGGPALSFNVRAESFPRRANARFGERITNAIGSNPCHDQDPASPATNAASCLALKHGMVLVVGTIDLQPCNRQNDTRWCAAEWVQRSNLTLV